MALFDVDQLSEVLEKEVLTELLAPCVKGQQYLSVVVPLIQRFLATNYHDVHQTHVDNGLPRVLSQFLFFKVFTCLQFYASSNFHSWLSASSRAGDGYGLGQGWSSSSSNFHSWLSNSSRAGDGYGLGQGWSSSCMPCADFLT